jgi:hypothetical protein
MADHEAPFIFALKHLRMEWDDVAPVEGRLMQGAREVPSVSGVRELVSGCGSSRW